MRYLSVCSGIEAATVAWHPLGWRAVAFSEIDKFPSAVLAHHYPNTPNFGDMTRFKEWPDAIVDVLVGGTPCQSFSVAGLRKGLADPRGNLMLTYLAIAARYRPQWLVWENVPGVLSADEGRAFGTFVGALGELGYGWAYRSLDAQYFNLAQRRERVFVVASLGSWQRAAAVLFECASLRGDSPPSRESREDVAATSTAGVANGGAWHGARSGHAKDANLIARCISTGEGNRQDFESTALVASPLPGHHPRGDLDNDTYIAHTLRADGFDASEDGTGRGIPLTLAIRGRGDSHDLEYRQDGLANAILTPNGGRGGIGVGAVAFDPTQITSKTNRSQPKVGEPVHTLAAAAPHIAYGWQNSARQGASASASASASVSPTLDKSKVPAVNVRRLTPRECERLQGFPDDYTLIMRKGKPAADGPRYKALGNSMAVPCMRWIGERIDAVEAAVARSERLVAHA